LFSIPTYAPPSSLSLLLPPSSLLLPPPSSFLLPPPSFLLPSYSILGLYSLYASDKSIYMGTTDGSLLRYNYLGEELVCKELQEVDEMIRAIEFHDGKLITGSHRNMVTRRKEGRRRESEVLRDEWRLYKKLKWPGTTLGSPDSDYFGRKECS
jgi:hypothetical protein